MKGNQNTSQQNASSFDAFGKLSTNQERAIEALLSGETASSTAKTVGVHRTTIHRWLADPHFVAALNQRRSDLREASQARLHRIEGSALDAVEQALTDGNPQVAIAVLKGVGLLDGKRVAIGPTDPAQIERQRRAAEREREFLDAVDPFSD